MSSRRKSSALPADECLKNASVVSEAGDHRCARRELVVIFGNGQALLSDELYHLS
jgi:hypothetical protein